LAKILIPSPIDLIQISVLRGLGQSGHECHVAWSENRLRRAFYSKHCRSLHTVPDPGTDPEAFSEAILALCATEQYDVVLPTSVDSLEALLPYATRLSSVTNILMPSQEQFAIGMDKIRTVEMCDQFGFPFPESVILSEETDIEDVARKFGFPLVVKHRRNYGGSWGVRCVLSVSEMKAAVAELTRRTGIISDLKIQRFIPGTLFDVSAVAKKGEIGVLVTEARRLMYPISGGVASTLVTVEIPELRKQAIEIIEALQWTGPIQIEFKRDPKTKLFSLIEINPRFWGTTGAWLREGINFPAIAVSLALHNAVTSPPSLAPGLRCRYVIGRTPYSLVQLWRAKGFSALWDPIKYNKTGYDFDLSDPLPELWRVYNEISTILRGGRSLEDNTLSAKFIPSYDD
jgi:predicted ATP-grasp superfamily ATP-dependent carboligase